MSNTIEFEKKDERTYVAFIGKAKAARVIEESGRWRIDYCDAVAGAWLPWESIDENKYYSANDAMVAVRGWASQ